jgi:hypothetical protein
MSKENPYVIGTRPTHTHNGSTGTWLCNSPYCEEMGVDPPELGGPAVIHAPYSPSNPPPYRPFQPRAPKES